MDICEAVNQRRSIRAFKPDPVPQEILGEILEVALRAPSWANTQPWEFAVVCGNKLDEIRVASIERVDEQPSPDLAGLEEFPEPFGSRVQTIRRMIFEAKGIGREDKETRRLWQLQGLRLFEAPCAIYIYIDRSLCFQGDGLNVWPVFDCGIVAENIMLLATKYELGTVPQMQSVYYPDVLRKVLGIADSKLIVLGMAIGYPNWDDPANQFRSERESLEKIVKWHGFS